MASKRSAWQRHLAWATPLGMLAAIGLALKLALDPPENLTGVVLGGLGAAMLLWIVVSVLWPARADRRCPACGKDGIVRIDEDEVVGIECTECGYRDEEVSAWFLAEEEGPLEEIVLRDRKRRRSSVDSARGED